MSQSLEKWVKRQLNKPRLQGVHVCLMKNNPGTSIAGAYHGQYGSNQKTSFRLHSEKYVELKAMNKPNLKGI